MNGVDAKLPQVTEPSRDRDELTWPAGIFIIECANMQFINHQLIPTWHREVVILPVEAGVVDNGIANRIGDLTRIGINACQHTSFRR